MSKKNAKKKSANQGRTNSPNITQKAALEARRLAEENQAKLCGIEDAVSKLPGLIPQPGSPATVAYPGDLGFKIDEIRNILDTMMKTETEKTRMADLGHVIDARERVIPLLNQVHVADDRSGKLIANVDVLLRGCISRLGGTIVGSAVPGDAFDPEAMEAVAMEEASDDTQIGTVHSVVSMSAYSYGGSVIRPQAVVVYGRGSQ